MSKHHDWQKKTEISPIISADNLTDVYVCAKCGKEISALTRINWTKTKYECQPRNVRKGKFKKLVDLAKAQNQRPMTEEEAKEVMESLDKAFKDERSKRNFNWF